MLYRGERCYTPADTLPMTMILLNNALCVLSLSGGVNTIASESGQKMAIFAPMVNIRGGVS